MSLFPAYADNKNEASQQQPEKPDWLENSSFQIPINESKLKPPQEPLQPQKVLEGKRKKKEKSHRNKKRKKEKSPAPEPVLQTSLESDDKFQIDKTRNREFLSVNTISRPSAPRYYIRFKVTKPIRRQKKFKRYHQVIYKKKNDDKSNSDEEIITQKNLSTIKSQQDKDFPGFKQEANLSEKTAYFNRELTRNPHDIKIWLKYVEFQDLVFTFEKTYRKGSVAKGLRVMAEKKLSILDKALSYNQKCEELLRKRLNVCVSYYPADELQAQLKKLVDKDQENIILWQGYIESYQCSMSHCNTPAVLNVYKKCLAVLHKLRRNSTIERAVLEESILRILYQCGLFLKQAGLFELLSTVLRLYLELNLTPTEDLFKFFQQQFNEKELESLEEVVFKSELPLHELWLRTEKLREACHWLPYQGDDCEDPQRLVFPDDVTELIHPITMPENLFKLIGTILSLLKIPLLPCRHSTFQDLGLDYVPWALDSVESLLPIFLNNYSIDLSNKHLVVDFQLAVGPQFLKRLPGQDTYLEFVLKTMKTCADCTKGDDKIATTIWWIRFQKLLIILDRDEKFKLPAGFQKKIKTNIKNLLKQTENRNNLIYYCEYAQLEFELGNRDSCINIIQTALKSKGKQIEINSEQSEICYLKRTLAEIYLKDCNNDLALKLLVNYALELGDVDDVGPLLEQTSLKFKHITLKLLESDLNKLRPVQHFLPNFLCEWIILNGWFLYLTKGPIAAGTFLEEILEKDLTAFQKEILYEFYVAILFKYCQTQPGSGIYKIFDDILYRAIKKFPNNLFLLTVMAKAQYITNGMGLPWWKLKSLILKTGRALPILFLILITNQQVNEFRENMIDTQTGQKLENNNLKNRMLSLFRQITKSDMCTRRCGLIWRLFLQFVHVYFDPVLCRNVYYTAVEECPWLKALYIDAAIYIPAELAQIQDLLIEKQLRLHVTPEELDVLRN